MGRHESPHDRATRYKQYSTGYRVASRIAARKGDDGKAEQFREDAEKLAEKSKTLKDAADKVDQKKKKKGEN